MTLEDPQGLQDPVEMAWYGVLVLLFGLLLMPLFLKALGRGWGTVNEGRDLGEGWSVHDLSLVVGVFLLLMVAVSVVVGSTFGGVEETPVLVLLSVTAVPLVGVVSVMGLLMRRRGVKRPFGLGGGRSIHAGKIGLLSWVISVPLIFGTALIWPWLLGLSPIPYEPQLWGSQLESLDGVAEVAGALLFVTLIIPVLEELVFRGLLQPITTGLFGAPAGILVTALIFALLHGVGAFLPILTLALVMGIVMHRTGRLASVVAIHVAHNGVQMLILFLQQYSEQSLS